MTEQVTRVLTLTDPEQAFITWVTPKMCKAWGITKKAALAAALANHQNQLVIVAMLLMMIAASYRSADLDL